MSEQHRYFPDWTLRSLANGPEIEAEDNSYLAGGYAEEFGYRALISYSPDVSELDGDVPESFREQRAQASPVHPGYPLEAHPVTSDLEVTRDGRVIGVLTSAFVHERVTAGSSTFVSVSNRPRRLDVLPRTTVVSIHLAAALVALRRALRRR